jgi:hypothetical protein
MRVEFIKDWQRFRVGQTAEHLSGGVVDALLRAKIVRLVALQPKPLDETTPPAPTKSKKGK